MDSLVIPEEERVAGLSLLICWYVAENNIVDREQISVKAVNVASRWGVRIFLAVFAVKCFLFFHHERELHAPGDAPSRNDQALVVHPGK